MSYTLFLSSWGSRCSGSLTCCTNTCFKLASQICHLRFANVRNLSTCHIENTSKTTFLTDSLNSILYFLIDRSKFFLLSLLHTFLSLILILLSTFAHFLKFFLTAISDSLWQRIFLLYELLIFSIELSLSTSHLSLIL